MVAFPLDHTNKTLYKRELQRCTKTPPSTSNNALNSSIKFRNLHGTTEATGFMRSLFHYITQMTPLVNGDSESVLKRTPPTSNNSVISSTKFWNMHRTTEATGFMSSLFHYYMTQITPLVNGDYESVLKHPPPTPNTLISCTNFWNLCGTTKKTGFISSRFHYVTQITLLVNGDRGRQNPIRSVPFRSVPFRSKTLESPPIERIKFETERIWNGMKRNESNLKL